MSSKVQVGCRFLTGFRLIPILGPLNPEWCHSPEAAAEGTSEDGAEGGVSAATQHAPPNESRLSCGRNSRGRKAAERQTKRLAGEATQFFPR